MPKIIERRRDKVVITQEYFEKLQRYKEEAKLAEEYFNKFRKFIVGENMEEALNNRTEDPEKLLDPEETDLDTTNTSVEL
ncbi:MAG: hypothetical protein SVV03_00160 [Candidatus Nanohaloarchaea archaeon]|nr:hypothetical protein [Candidatus Nanohaloarchaea archaeon]